jgi:hypothetical protein
VLAGLLLTVYVALTFGIIVTNVRIENVYKRQIPGEKLDGQGQRNPANLSDGDVAEILRLNHRLLQLLYTTRWLITMGSWCVKAAFVAVFWDIRDTFGRGTMIFLGAVTFIIVGSAAIAAWLLAKDELPQLMTTVSASAEQIRYVVLN